MEGRFFEITLVKSPIGLTIRQKEILRGMGLRRVGSSSILKDTHQARGMIFNMSHMLDVRPFNSQAEYEKYIATRNEFKELPVIIEGVVAQPKVVPQKITKAEPSAAKKPEKKHIHAEEKDEAKAKKPVKKEEHRAAPKKAAKEKPEPAKKPAKKSKE
jgi:large subunit ribosomal protein L30